MTSVGPMSVGPVFQFDETRISVGLHVIPWELRISSGNTYFPMGPRISVAAARGALISVGRSRLP